MVNQIEKNYKAELKKESKQFYKYGDTKLLQCYYDMLYKRDINRKYSKHFRSMRKAFAFKIRMKKRYNLWTID